VTNPLASQQPAPIPEDLKEEYEYATKHCYCCLNAPRQKRYIERIARLEAALTALRDFMWSEGYADQAAVMRQADASLGTPGRGEK
jgi:hypothetical protein